MRARAWLLLVVLADCAPPRQPPRAPPPPPPLRSPPPRPLAEAELQQMVDGAARLNRSCRDQRSPSGLYLVRLLIDPDGKVSKVEPRRAPSRAQDASGFSGVPPYLDGDRDADTPVLRCFAAAFLKLRFRRFGGDRIAFDYPIVVENLPPAEPVGEERRCQRDEGCVFRPPTRCACPPCGHTWRRAFNRQAAEKLQRQRRKRCRRHACPACTEPLLLVGERALCIEGQCSVR